MECAGFGPANLPYLLKVLKQIAAKAPRFPSETEGEPETLRIPGSD
jgi:hypothetical protein